MKFFAAFALPAVLALARLSAQEPAAESGQNENHTFTVHSDLVFLPTLVQDRKGETIRGLKPEQFIVEDNGVRQPVRVEEGPDSTGISLVIAVECSRSAPSEFNKFRGLGAMTEAIVGDAPHEVAVLSYGEGPHILGDFSSSSEAVRHALGRLRACGDFHAATIDAAQYAINMLKRRQNHYRRAILLVSETRDHGSRAKLHDVVAELGVTDTVIYSVAFSPTKDEIISSLRYGDNRPAPPPKPFEIGPSPPHVPPPADDSADTEDYPDHPPLFELPPQLLLIINALRQNSASELASLSGGEYMSFATQRGFDKSLERISNEIHNYYLLSFKPPYTSTLSLHSLRVRVADYPDAAIQTRRAYWSGILE